MPIKIPDGFLEIMKVNMQAHSDIKRHVFDVCPVTDGLVCLQMNIARRRGLGGDGPV